MIPHDNYSEQLYHKTEPRKHSRGMRTACLSTIRASAARCQYWWGAQVNKFEEVFSVSQQMSLAGAPISHVRGGGLGKRGPVQWGPMYHWQWSHRDTPTMDRMSDWRRDTTGNIFQVKMFKFTQGAMLGLPSDHCIPPDSAGYNIFLD